MLRRTNADAERHQAIRATLVPGCRRRVVYETDTVNMPLSGTSWISVRIAQFYEDDVANLPGVALDVLIGLADPTTEVLVRLG